MSGAEIARASRAAQGLPPTVEDDAALDDLAALIVASTGQSAVTVPNGTPKADGEAA